MSILTRKLINEASKICGYKSIYDAGYDKISDVLETMSDIYINESLDIDIQFNPIIKDNIFTQTFSVDNINYTITAKIGKLGITEISFHNATYNSKEMLDLNSKSLRIFSIVFNWTYSLVSKYNNLIDELVIFAIRPKTDSKKEEQYNTRVSLYNRLINRFIKKLDGLYVRDVEAENMINSEHGACFILIKKQI